MLKYLARWGGWPAAIIGAITTISGINIVTTAQNSAAARPLPTSPDDPLFNLDLALMAYLGMVFVIAGILALLVVGISRLKNRVLSMVGIAGCFILGVLVAGFSIVGRLPGAELAWALAGAGCLLLAGAAALIQRWLNAGNLEGGRA